MLAQISSLFRQVFNFKSVLNTFILAAIPAFIIYIVSLFILKKSGFDIMQILRDPAQQSGQSSFLGFISNIGIWVWVSATAISFFAITTKEARKQGEFLFLTGLFSLILAVDDFFMIHDRYIDEKICYAFYAVTLLALMVRHFSTIIKIDGFAFIMAGGLLALSILTDLIQLLIPLSYQYSQVIEEGFKFGGACTWLYFCIRSAQASISQQV